MAKTRYGIWLIGARGGVAVATLAGLSAVRRGLASGAGLVTERPPFQKVRLPAWDEFVVGGHDIREASLVEELERLHRESRVLSPELVAGCRDDLAAAESNLRPGTIWNVGSSIAGLASNDFRREATARAALERIVTDLRRFQESEQLDSVVVINLASTEATPATSDWPEDAQGIDQLLQRDDCPLPASTIYAIAAFTAGMPYVNFTPSLGSTPSGVDAVARRAGVCHAGRDGKTGETLLKSVLAPMFLERNLEVMSWVGHNIFGNLDGQVLSDPQNKQSKLQSKDHLLSEVLGYAPQTHISIEHIGSLGDWKTAWDHIHFRGFLDTPMTLQFTWQGCDSLLAAPLVLDLARLTLASAGRGEVGVLHHLSSFFKSPLGGGDQSFPKQVAQLEAWLDLAEASPST